ncbi:MAG: hypothetical protein JO006_21000 [Paucibacter sp.]|nr:hypothetical protein [Roseateles sp.]
MEWSLALVLLVMLVALVGALRWDALRAGLLALFSARDEAAPPIEHLNAPRHLHDELARHHVSHKPQIHRSGRRG